MTNSEKLRALADWFDSQSKRGNQFYYESFPSELRAMATEFEQLQQHSVMQAEQLNSEAMDVSKIICPVCGSQCYADTYKIFGCPICQKKEYDEMQNQKMNIKHNGLD